MSPDAITSLEHNRITVGIVTYNSARHIISCLESISKQLADAAPAVVILDNASSDDTLPILNRIRKKYRYPLQIITHSENHGYAWAINRIAELARTEWLCFINPDARLLTPPFQCAKDIVRRFPTCGVIGGVIVDQDGKPQECGGAFPTPLMAVWDWCGLRHLLPLKNWSTTLKLKTPEKAAPLRIDYPTGAFWILRREVFQRVGPFDEQFFLYFEETDFCRRARNKSWPSFIHPGIRIEHIKGASFNTQDMIIQRDPFNIYFESLIKYLYKHFPGWKVNAALKVIRRTLGIRKWLRKDEKTDTIIEAFEFGETKALEHINIIKKNKQVEKQESEKNQ